MTAGADPAPAGLDAVRLRPFGVLAECVRVYRVHWRRLVLAALIVFAPLAALDAVIEHFDFGAVGIRVVEAAVQAMVHLIGDVLYAGLIAAAVIAWREQDRPHGPRTVARKIRWRTILTLDLLLAVCTAVLLVALIVPGVVFYTYFALAPALVELDHVGVRESLRRSARLVRGSFWRVLVVLLVVVVFAGVVEQVLQALVDAFVGNMVVNLLISMIGAPFFGLAIVLVTLDLRRAADAAGQ